MGLNNTNSNNTQIYMICICNHVILKSIIFAGAGPSWGTSANGDANSYDVMRYDDIKIKAFNI